MTKRRAARAPTALPAAPLPTTLRRRGRSQQSAARCPAPGGAPECGARRGGGGRVHALRPRRPPPAQARPGGAPRGIAGRCAAPVRAVLTAVRCGAVRRALLPAVPYAALRALCARRSTRPRAAARALRAPPHSSPRPAPKAGGATRGPAAPVQWPRVGPTWGGKGRAGIGRPLRRRHNGGLCLERGTRRPCAARRRCAHWRGPMRRRGAPRGSRAPFCNAPPRPASAVTPRALTPFLLEPFWPLPPPPLSVMVGAAGGHKMAPSPPVPTWDPDPPTPPPPTNERAAPRPPAVPLVPSGAPSIKATWAQQPGGGCGGGAKGGGGWRGEIWGGKGQF